MAKHWAQEKEVAGSLLLNITLFFVKKTPRFIVKIVVFIVVSVYFVLLKKQRKNINDFRVNVKNSGGTVNGGAYANFYNFAFSICDKIAVWLKKNNHCQIDRSNIEDIKSKLCGGKGKVLLTSHYGNLEVSKAVVSELDDVKINIFMYRQHSVNFNKLMSQISDERINIFWVDEFDFEVMLGLQNLINKGEHIAIMADRIPIKSEKILSSEFLGKKANFSAGAYLIAGILKAEIYSFWSYKIDGKYKFEAVKLPSVELKKDKITSIMPTLKAYITDLEEKCKKDPDQWYNFFDFWGQGEI